MSSPPPPEKNPQIQPVILFQQIQLCCIGDVKDDHRKNKKNGNKNIRSSIFALKLVLLRHKPVTSSVFKLLISSL